MRTGVSFFVTSADTDRLRALVKDRNAPPGRAKLRLVKNP
jgi:hypothetical protein